MKRESEEISRIILIPESPDPVPLQRVRHAFGGSISDDDEAFCESNVTGQVQLTVSSGETEWTLETLNIHGEPTKSNRLDEIYMVYHTHAQSVAGNRPLAVAQLERDDAAWSNRNSSNVYRVKFFASPMNYRDNVKKRGHISIHFQFTDGIGELPPPTKQEWRNGGYSHTRYIFRNVETPPVIHPFVPPKTIGLSQFSAVLAFGDSILEQLVGLDSSSERKIQFGAKVAQPLHSRSVATLLDSLHASFPPSETNENNILILNSALWDVLSDQASEEAACRNRDDPWEDHCNALRTYLQEVRSMYSSTKVAWLLPTAVHIHRVYLADVKLESRAPQKINRCRYMSSSRCFQLHARQKKICEELNVPTLDLFRATYLSADWTLPGDGRHFQPELNQKMLGWFY